jgi:hypothetical protein
MKPDNPFSGIEFTSRSETYCVTITRNGSTELLGPFRKLEDAVKAKRAALHSTSQGHDEK